MSQIIREEYGALIDVIVEASGQRAELLKAAGQPIPQRRLKALIDPGSPGCYVDGAVIEYLQLPAMQRVLFSGITQGSERSWQYEASMLLVPDPPDQPIRVE